MALGTKNKVGALRPLDGSFYERDGEWERGKCGKTGQKWEPEGKLW